MGAHCHPPRPPHRRYYGGGNATIVNDNNKAVPFPFVTAYLRGGTDGFMLKGGDATFGTLTTMYDGPRPFVNAAGQNTNNRKYQPAKKQGAIILGEAEGVMIPIRVVSVLRNNCHLMR